MRIRIFDRQIDDFVKMSTGNVTGCGRWCSAQRWRRLWSWLWSLLSVSVGRRCTCSFASPACLWIVGSAIVERKASGGVVLRMHSGVSFYCSPHLLIPRKLNTPLLLFSDLSSWFLHQILDFLYCDVRKPSFGHVGQVQGLVHVGLFQLYTTSLPCHRSRHVKYLQVISCSF